MSIAFSLYHIYNTKIGYKKGGTMELKDFQKKQAVDCFNKTWDYIDMETRSDEDNLNMIHCAHASRFLWGQIGEPLNFERGEWQISKVYALVGKGEQALYHAKECLRICLEHDIKDFDIAFAYEAMAKAYKVLGDEAFVEDYKKKAYDCIPDIEKEGDREYTKSELDKI